MEGDFHSLSSSLHSNNQIIKKIVMPWINGSADDVSHPSSFCCLGGQGTLGGSFWSVEVSEGVVKCLRYGKHTVRAHLTPISPVSLFLCSTRLHRSRGAGSLSTHCWIILRHTIVINDTTSAWKADFLQVRYCFQHIPPTFSVQVNKLHHSFTNPFPSLLSNVVLASLSFLPHPLCYTCGLCRWKREEEGWLASFPPRIYYKKASYSVIHFKINP